MKLAHYMAFADFGAGLVRHKLFGGNKPLILVWSITNRCNLSCEYCGLPDLDHSRELRGEALLQYLQAAITSGVKIISLTGGEPLVHQDIELFMETASRHGIALSLNSNGLMIRKKLELIKKYCFQVVISWDGLEEYHDPLRGRGSFKRALDAIELLRANGIRCHTTCVFTRQSYDKLGLILQKAKEMDIKVNFQPVWHQTLTYQPHAIGLSPENLQEALDYLIAQKREGNPHLDNSLDSLEYWLQLHKQPQVVRCHAGQIFARIEPNGDLKKCGRVEEIIPYTQVREAGLEPSMRQLLQFKDCLACHSWASINANWFL